MWIDHSTTDHEQNKVFAEALSKSGGSLLEAPITGGLEALKKGQMAVWVAGDKVTLFKHIIISLIIFSIGTSP